MPKDIPIIDATSKSFKDELAFNIWSTHSCSDYRNDRERPYDGQIHTDDGIRGKTEVKDLTMRDIKDCLVKAMLTASVDDEYLKVSDNFLKCWDWEKGKDKNGNLIPTQFLLDKQKEDKFLCTKVETNTWRYNDIYKIDFNNIDPGAILGNLICEIEKMMGIYPNVNILECDAQTEKMFSNAKEL